MAGDWFKMLGDVAEAFGVFDRDEIPGGLGAYLRGESTQTTGEGDAPPIVYERVLTRPRDPSVNDR